MQLQQDVHSRYRTESHQEVVARFNERFILSLTSCTQCLVVDDQLNILPISSSTLEIEPLPPKSIEDSKSPEEIELLALKESMQDTQPGKNNNLGRSVKYLIRISFFLLAGSIVSQAKTLDQAKAVLKFIDSISEKTLRSPVTLTAARGRGKSAALGLAISAAVAYG